MSSQVDVYNLCLTHLDISQTVASVNDSTQAARICGQFYDFARKRVLEKAHWDFATKSAAMGLLVDQSTFTSQAQIIYPGWRYIYARPNDCLRTLAVTTQYGLRLTPFSRAWWFPQGSQPQWGPFRPPYRETLDMVSNPVAQSIDILTDQDAAWIVYVTDVTNTNLWSMAFMEAVAWNLAVYVAGPLSANQAAKKLCVQMAEQSITAALGIELNQKQEDPYPDSPAITARN